jgi:hypothetical protein
MSLYRLLTGKPGQFGPQKYFYPDGKKEVHCASTAKRPTPETMRIARGLLDGTLTPPNSVRSSRPSAYVELGKASKKLGPDGKPLQPEYTPEKILAKQQSTAASLAASTTGSYMPRARSPSLPWMMRRLFRSANYGQPCYVTAP